MTNIEAAITHSITCTAYLIARDERHDGLEVAVRHDDLDVGDCRLRRRGPRGDRGHQRGEHNAQPLQSQHPSISGNELEAVTMRLAMKERIIIRQHSSNADDPDGTERRLALMKRNRELAEHFVSQSAHKDMVVLIFDISEQGAFPEADAAWVHRVIEEGGIPAMLLGMSRYRAYKAMQRFQRELHKIDARDPKQSPVVEKLAVPAPAGHFYLMTISKGKQVAVVPVPT